MYKYSTVISCDNADKLLLILVLLLAEIIQIQDLPSMLSNIIKLNNTKTVAKLTPKMP